MARMTLDCPEAWCGWFVSVDDPLFPSHRDEHLASLALAAHLEAEHPETLTATLE